jgi:hypothetical protein
MIRLPAQTAEGPGRQAPARPRAAAAAACLVVLALARAAAAGDAPPYWFEDHYTTTASVDLAATTAAVDTSGSGTVRLPYAPVEVAFDPHGSYALVATERGVAAEVFDGRAVRAVTPWNLGTLDATGVTWVASGAALAVSTPTEVAVYGVDALGRVVLGARAAISGIDGLAPGPAALPSAVLAGTSSGAQLLEAQGADLVPLSGGPWGQADNLGVAATADGSVAATWQPEGVEIWTWSGAAYRRAPAWDPPVPPLADGPIAGVAFFPQGGGYWVLTGEGQLFAYAYGTAGASFLAGLSISLATDPALPAGIAAGWSPGAVGVLYPWGWTYASPGGAGTLRPDPARSLTGQTWAMFAPAAVLQSVALSVDHSVTAVRVEDAACAAGEVPPACAAPPVLPPGTAIAYAVSTDGCATWTPAAAFANVALPGGSALCYRLLLTTADPTLTPVVDVTALYEIAAEPRAGTAPALLCSGGSC